METKCKVVDMWVSYLKLLSSFFIKRMILESTVSNHKDVQNQTVRAGASEREREKEPLTETFILKQMMVISPHNIRIYT